MTLFAVSWFFILLGIATALVIAVDVYRHPQHMGVMNITWPITGLYLPVLGAIAYWVMGRPDGMTGHHHEHTGHDHHGDGCGHHHAPKPKWQSVFVGVTHCGGGCTIGDCLAAPIVAAAGFTVLGSTLLGHYVGAFIGAYIFGLAFQILPAMQMGETNLWKAFVNAVKADTVSLIAFEIGMFAWLAIAFLGILGHEPSVASPVYWFHMQIAMLFGFITAYPANWWLINRGIKHGM
ncbi:DUF4396 domain-containing protein [Salinisphaera sp. Q1T1-3]|uniref:DUF4396 domain-containing protein n=1 Tax=Salinisphaera sp. Q1T1-3 TaxID=2321229 RepID=UPI000E74F98C|nr:DUF4396 domain-containing protein [Salinisphaera sp. Q1T1-3]RJS93029.1 DUF4396 domain-containing protein [Salinisphaera sp. Q1T1-3]